MCDDLSATTAWPNDSFPPWEEMGFHCWEVEKVRLKTGYWRYKGEAYLLAS